MQVSETNGEQVLRNLGPVTLERVADVEARMLAMNLPQADCPLTHHFAPGVCVRQVVMPAGHVCIGHAHRFADLNIMLTGRLTLLMEDGSLKELKAPQTFLGQPGRKIAYIHEDVIWQNVWPTELTDVEAIEAHFLDKSPAWVANNKERLAMERLRHAADREDFEQWIGGLGLTLEMVQSAAVNTVYAGLGNCHFQVSESPIAGVGVFATSPVASGDVIAERGDKLFPMMARFINHSPNPNVRVEDGKLVAIRPLAGCRGGQLGDELTLNYRELNF